MSSACPPQCHLPWSLRVLSDPLAPEDWQADSQLGPHMGSHVCHALRDGEARRAPLAQTRASPPLPSSLASVARGTPTPRPQLAEGPAPCLSPGRPWLYGPCHQERSGHREPLQPGHTPVSVSLCHPTATPRGALGHPLLCFGHVLPRPDPLPQAAKAQLTLGSDPSRLSPGPSTHTAGAAEAVGLGSHTHPLPLPPPAWPSWGSTAET